MFHSWLTLARFDPNGFHDPARRLAVIVMFGRNSYAADFLLQADKTAATGDPANIGTEGERS